MPHGEIDPLDDLEDFIKDILIDAGVPDRAQPCGFATVYDDNGKPFCGKVFERRESADNAMVIMSQSMRPLFRVNVYPPRGSRQ